MAARTRAVSGSTAVSIPLCLPDQEWLFQQGLGRSGTFLVLLGTRSAAEQFLQPTLCAEIRTPIASHKSQWHRKKPNKKLTPFALHGYFFLNTGCIFYQRSFSLQAPSEREKPKASDGVVWKPLRSPAPNATPFPGSERRDTVQLHAKPAKAGPAPGSPCHD